MKRHRYDLDITLFRNLIPIKTVVAMARGESFPDYAGIPDF